MSVLVTGGAGYIGSHTVGLLRARGDQVVVLDTLELGHRAGDRRHAAGRGQHPRRGRWSAACCATTSSRRSSTSPPTRPPASRWATRASTSTTTCCGTLQPARGHARTRGCSRFVFSSTAAVYGNPEVLPVVETADAAPREPLRREQAAWSSRCCPGTTQAFGLRSVALRYFNAAGAVLDGSIGEDPRYVAEPDPAGDEGRHRPRPHHQGVRHRLPHPRRHLHPRLHPRAGSGRRPPAALDYLARRATRATSSTWAPARAPRCKEVLAAATAASRQSTSPPSTSPAAPAIRFGLRRQHQGPHPARAGPRATA